MKIIKTYPANKELTPRDIYKHTRNSSKPLKDEEDGHIIEPVDIVFYEDVNGKGEKVTICSIMAKDGEHYATTSKYFSKEIEDIINLFGDEGFAVKLRKPVSKGGRTFVTCELV